MNKYYSFITTIVLASALCTPIEAAWCCSVNVDSPRARRQDSVVGAAPAIADDESSVEPSSYELRRTCSSLSGQLAGIPGQNAPIIAQGLRDATLELQKHLSPAEFTNNGFAAMHAQAKAVIETNYQEIAASSRQASLSPALKAIVNRDPSPGQTPVPNRLRGSRLRSKRSTPAASSASSRQLSSRSRRLAVTSLSMSEDSDIIMF